MRSLAVFKGKYSGAIKAAAKVMIALGVIALAVMLANNWQRAYLTLPEPVVMQPSTPGVQAPAVTAGLDKYDILLLGLDARADEPELGDRTDTILLVTIDPDENYASILSIPRDTRIRYEGKWRKINEVYTADGAEGSVRAVEELLQMHIDRFAVVDFQGVIELVDLMDGVVVDVPVNMYKPLENIDLKKGPEQHLGGYDALAYMRYRDEWLSDMDRSERQKEVLLQLADKLLQPRNLLKLPTIASTALAYMKTNISLQEIITLAKFGRTILNNGVENRVLPGVNDYYLGGWYYVSFLEELGLPMGEAEIEYRAYLAEKEAAEAAAEAEADEEAAGAEEAEGAAGVEEAEAASEEEADSDEGAAAAEESVGVEESEVASDEGAAAAEEVEATGVEEAEATADEGVAGAEEAAGTEEAGAEEAAGTEEVEGATTAGE